MSTAILGMGVTGLSCLRYLAGEALLVLDTRDEPPNAAAARALCPEAELRFGADACGADFAGVERLVVSPGVGLDHPLVERARGAGVEVLSDIDLFCRAARAPIHAVTGTNGKSTVTALAGHLLAALGQRVGVGGNIGEAALEVLGDDRDSYVLELSSFQLERMASYPFHAATILNVTEDHLDRHGDLAAYAASKRRIYRQARRVVANRQDPLTAPQEPGMVPVTFGLDAPQDGHWGLSGRDTERVLMRGGEVLMPLAELPLAGIHNALNVLAACALVAEPGVPLTRLADAVRSFRGLPHRCTLVAEVAGVRFVDDSKATNVGATLAALDGLGDPARRHLVLIAGGDGKGADFAPLAGPVKRYVKAVVLLGRDAPRLASALGDSAPLTRVADMNEAVAAAGRLAEHGDTVLLSPACASLDMFRSYAARGEAFAAAVEALS